jgi:hypothetical protein
MSSSLGAGRDAVVTIEKTEIRSRARAFAKSWATATSEQSDKQPFWDEFFHIFGVRRRQVATYEAIAKRSSTGRIGWLDLLLPGQLGIEHKSAGEPLVSAMEQLVDYLPSLPAAETSTHGLAAVGASAGPVKTIIVRGDIRPGSRFTILERSDSDRPVVAAIPPIGLRYYEGRLSGLGALLTLL